MKEKPEALRLADAIDPLTRNGLDNLTCAAAAAELRRLHAENAELLEALKELTEVGAEAWGEDRPCVRIGLAAIAKAEGEKT